VTVSADVAGKNDATRLARLADIDDD